MAELTTRVTDVETKIGDFSNIQPPYTSGEFITITDRLMEIYEYR